MSFYSEHRSKIEIFFSFLLAAIPLSFILGNLIININIILIILISLIIFNKSIIFQKFDISDYLIFLFFFLVIFTSTYNNIYFIITDAPPKGYGSIIKSFLFLKYLFLYLSIKFLVKEGVINFKFFFIVCLICSVFVCFDIVYQFIFGVDIFGYEILNDGRRLSGPFGDEMIAGGYLQRFSIFSFFLIPIFYENYSKKYSKFIIPILFVIFTIGIILSGNRMPLIFFFMITFAIIFFQKQLRKFLIFFILVFSILFLLTYNFNSNVKTNFTNFYIQVTKMALLVSNKDFNNTESPQYLKEFSSFYETWLMNKYIGGGIKNFRYYCHIRPNIKIDDKSNFVCNMHPHNYYLEVLTETGIFGFVIISLVFFLILYKTIYRKYFLRSYLADNKIITPFIFIFLAEIFPIKSTGSFFTTGNTTFLFIIIAVLLGISSNKNLIEKN